VLAIDISIISFYYPLDAILRQTSYLKKKLKYGVHCFLQSTGFKFYYTVQVEKKDMTRLNGFLLFSVLEMELHHYFWQL